MTLYEDGALDVVCTALRSSPSHAGVQFTGRSSMSNLARAGTWLHMRQCVCVCARACVCVCVCVCTGPAVIVLCTCVPALFTEHRQTRTCCVACIHFLIRRWIVTKICCCLLVYYVAVGVHICMYVCMYVRTLV